ncbi:Hypothetical protein A7982_10805 [Minicystis rosea]|nr:Hypothetical protein A7982_10805 [Minicystis rosea]
MTTWHPTWWSNDDDDAWARVKEAIRRDWEQTKHDLHLPGGHELNQGASDTVRQALHRQPIPADDRPNPPKVIGTWDDIEGPVAYGYGARRRYGEQHPDWSERLEMDLRLEWEKGKQDLRRAWDDIKRHVQHGYDYSRKH